MILFEPVAIPRSYLDPACLFHRREAVLLACERFELSMGWWYCQYDDAMYCVPASKGSRYVAVVVICGQAEFVLRQVVVPDDNYTFNKR